MKSVALGFGTAATHQSSVGQSCWYAQVRRRPRSASVSCVCAALALLAGSPTAAQPPTLELLSTLEGPADLVAVDGDYAYVSAANELRVVDLSEPTRPAVRGSLSVIGRIYFIYVVDQTVYLVCGLDGLHIVDVSNPSSPRLLSTHQTAGQALDITIFGSTALIPNLMTGMEVVDVSDRSAPVLLSTEETPGYQWAIGSHGPLVFVVDQPHGLHLYDVSNPEEPTALGVRESEQLVQSIAFGDNNQMYVVYARSGLVEILDITDPVNSRSLGSYQSSGRFQRVAVRGTRLLTPMGRAGVELVDVSNPSAPTPIGSYDTPGTPGGVALTDELIVVADGTALLIIRE